MKSSKEYASGPAYTDTGRRGFLKTAAGMAAGTAAWSFPGANAWGKNEKPVTIGVIDPRTGTYAAMGESEISGAQMAAAELNENNGILGRPVRLMVEDSAASVGQAVQKTRKLINRNNADFLIGAVSSSVALSVSQTSAELGVPYIVTGGHADAVTAEKCNWNTFRTCSTTWMLTAGDFQVLFDKYGKRWYFLTPDYSFGHALVHDYSQQLKKAGGTVAGNALAPLGTTDFSSYLIKARSANPDVLIVLCNGNDLVNALKQITQFGINKQVAVGGALLNMESIEALPQAARYGWWVLEWYWKQPGVPHVDEFVARYRKMVGDSNKVPTARTWLGYASTHALALASEKAGSLDARKVCKALEGLELPPEVALQPNKAYYRAGDHQLIGSQYAGQIISDGEYPNLFKVAKTVDASTIARSVEAKGCKITYPSA